MNGPFNINSKQSRIGDTVTIKGDIDCNEDVIIEGVFNGNIDVKSNTIIIGINSSSTGNFKAKHVVIIGRHKGDIDAEDLVEVTSTGFIEGDIRANNVNLKDGCTLRGGIYLKR